MPHSEPPGPFVASDVEEPASLRKPSRNGARWVLALSAVLAVGVAVALLRGIAPHGTALHTSTPQSIAVRAAESSRHSATSVEPLPTPNEPSAPAVQVETAATTAESSAVELPITPPAEAPQVVALPAPAERAKQLELAPPRVTTKSAVTEPLGALDITSDPPTSLVLDGRPVGRAPRSIQLPPGPHTVLFIHPERGRMSVTVNVRAGRTTSASADF